MTYEMHREPRFGIINMGDRWFVTKLVGGVAKHLICEAAGEITAARIASSLNHDPRVVHEHFESLAAS